MGLRRDSDKSKDQPAKKSGSGVKRKVGAAGKQDTATQPIQQDENEQVGEPARSTSVMSLTDNEAGSSDVDTQAIPATAIAGSSDVDTQAIPATAIAENADERHQNGGSRTVRRRNAGRRRRGTTVKTATDFEG
ncbi:MAG: hypothetical protein ACR2FI_01375 [Burkholderiales bacterium]